MDPTQLYETTIYDRDGGQAFSFVTVPARSLVPTRTPSFVQELAQELSIRPADAPGRLLDPLEAWSLPFFLDVSMGLREGTESFGWVSLPVTVATAPPSPFAQYLTYAPVVPFESSPLAAKSLAELIVGGGASGAVGYVSGHPFLVLYVAAGIVICRGAHGLGRGVAEALQIAARAKLLSWMGVEDPREAEPAGGVDEDEDEAS